MNAEPVLLSWLTSTFPDVRAVTILPADLADEIPLVRVSTTSNPVDRFRFETPSLDLDVYADTITGARDLAKRIGRAVLEQMPGASVNDVSVLSTTVRDLGVTPYDNTNVSRRTLVIGMRLHDRSAA